MKTSKRAILFRVGAIAILLIVSAIMLIIGRGHTIYIDNKTFEYNGQTYTAPYKVEVSVGGEQIAKLYSKERGMSTCIGQKFKMDLNITSKKGGTEETVTVMLKLPYSMDGIVVNLPAYLAGLPAEAYISEFQYATAESEAPADEAPVDEFALPDTETEVVQP